MYFFGDFHVLMFSYVMGAIFNIPNQICPRILFSIIIV